MNNDDLQSNKNKALRGAKIQNALKAIINELYEKNCIINIDEKFPRKAVQNGESYKLYAKCILHLPNEEKWAIFTTSSLRERVKQDHWDSFLLKHYKEADKCYLVYFSSIKEKERELFVKENDKIQRIKSDNNLLDELDEIISDTELYYKIANISYEQMPHGRKEDKAGRDFESNIVDVLNNENNLKFWNGDVSSIGKMYPIFSMILFKFGMSENGKIITNISATDKIPLLPSKGLPKTDIAVTITYDDNSSELFTISCKNSKSPHVSCNEYHISKYIQALNITDNQLIDLLYQLQEIGAPTKMEPTDLETLKRLLAPYVDRLCEWVITGKHGECDQPQIQCANYVLSFDKEKFICNMYTADDYIAKIKSNSKDNTANIGTPFTWTYPSKKRGKAMVLKMPMLKDL